jgi:hypothetical protein
MSKTGAPRKALNLTALRAQQADARGEKYVRFTLTREDGEGGDEELSFRVLRRSWWPVKLLLSLEDVHGDVQILRELMGQEQFDLACEAGLDISDMKAIFNEVMGRDVDDADEEADASLGESSGSSES